MATESPLIHDTHLTLSTLYDARRSSITGTTLNGPNGSAQFFPVFMSTVNDLQATLSTAGTIASTNVTLVGILQNTPGPGEACDVGIFGVTKAIAGSTFVRGQLLSPSGSIAGGMTTYSTGNGPPTGFAMETVTSTGTVFTMGLFGFGQGGHST